MNPGDLVIKGKGAQAGRVGVIMRVYNRNNEGHVILEVLSGGELLKWAESWCAHVGVKNDIQIT